MLDYYIKKEDINGNMTFEKVEDMRICDYTIPEIMDILNGLEIERILGIKMTMENLSELSKKMNEDFNKTLQKSLDNMYR